MATIQTALRLYDGFSGPLRGITKVLDTCLTSFEAMQGASGNAIDAESIRQARGELSRASTAFDDIENNIRQADQAQRQLNTDIRNGESAANDLGGKIKRVVTTLAAAVGVNKVMELSDTLTSTRARLGLIVDDLNTVETLQEKIYASAQASRGSYLDSLATVGKLGLQAGKAFTGNDEMIKFVELMNKNFVIAGASTTEQASAMYQLTQAMGSGRLQGDEYRSIIENAPLLATAIEDYMRNVQGAEGSMKEWASEGLLTADVIKAALFNSADEIEARFAQMPMTWGQVWTSMKNKALVIFQPILNKINELINTEKFQNAADGVIQALTVLAAIAGAVFGAMVEIANFMYENWSWIEPIVWAVVAAMIAYNAVSIISKTITMASAIAAKVKAASDMLQAGATISATAAQYGLNAALLACPLTWIILLIIAIIALFFVIIGLINKITGKSISGIGVIAGGINWLIQLFKNVGLWVANVALGIWEALGACCSNVGIAFHNVIANIKGWFYGMLATVINVVAGICEALNKLPFISFDYSGIVAKADEYAAKSAEAYGSVEEYVSVADAFDAGFNTFDTFSDGWGKDAYDAGYEWGAGLEDNLSNAFSMDDLDAYGASGTWDEIAANTGDTAGSAADCADALDITNEDLAYLRDIAEREAINRFTTAEINIEQHNENHIASDVDVDGVIDRLCGDFAERLDISAEGVNE